METFIVCASSVAYVSVTSPDLISGKKLRGGVSRRYETIGDMAVS